MTLEAARNGAGLPDMSVSVRQVFGIDTDLEVPAYSQADPHVPDIDPDYQFNKGAIHHPFCKTCGIESYAYGKGPGGKDMVMLNVRCLDGVDAERFKVKKFDGASL